MDTAPLPDDCDADGSPAAAEDNRQSGRFQLEDLRCSIGQIVDISAGGFRVRAKRRPPDRTVIRISGTDTAISVPIKVVWAKRLGWRSWELGFRFETHDPAIRAVLNYVCRDYRVSEEFGWADNPPPTPGYRGK